MGKFFLFMVRNLPQVRFDCWFNSIVGLIQLLLQHLCVVCLPVLLESDGLVAAGRGGGGRAARAAGGDACTGACIDAQRRFKLLRSHLLRQWRRGAHARCSSARCWAQYEPLSRGKISWRKRDPTWRKDTPPSETLTPLFPQGLVLDTRVAEASSPTSCGGTCSRLLHSRHQQRRRGFIAGGGRLLR